MVQSIFLWFRKMLWGTILTLPSAYLIALGTDFILFGVCTNKTKSTHTRKGMDNILFGYSFLAIILILMSMMMMMKIMMMRKINRVTPGPSLSFVC